MIFWSLLPVVIAFSFIMFVIYRMRREAVIRSKEAEYKQHTAEVEMKALRAQMNPHFIFNALNSIYVFIQQKDNAQATDYLLKFSKLIRLVLENSMHKEVSLKEDIEALELYMQLEQLRIRNGFDYVFNVESGLDTESVYVPPLILQPFIENSIWHGFNTKPEKGVIQIHIRKQKDRLHIVVEDNGVESAEKTSETDSKSGKKRSLGMALTRERLQLLNTNEKREAEIFVSDLRTPSGVYQGKHVELVLPLQMD
ncbi:MAG TPA: histidine kinase [Bacteroidia bacterium]|nr:histidine kinase [Bacteroidia bacterium]